MKRIVQGERIVHVVDIADDEAYRAGDPTRRAFVEIGGFHTLLGIALRKDDALLGALHVYRREIRPFSEKQIALLQNFAAQAVIAMENARLLTETREALEQQTATADVLQVINSSPGDLAPVFDAMLEKAVRLCEATYGPMRTYDGERFHLAAVHGDPRLSALHRHRPAFAPGPHSPITRTVRGERIVHIPNAMASDHYRDDVPFRELADSGVCRAMLLVALRRDETLVGFIAVYRQDARPFSDKQIALLQNFAAQAVIATENARLLTETREALELQTATAEVLQVINSSPGDLTPVFDAMVERAMRLCEASIGGIYSYEDHGFRAVALRGVPEAYADFLQQEPLRPVPNSGLGRIGTGEPIVHIHDVAADEAYGSHNPAGRTLLELGGARTVLLVSLTKDDNLLGAIFVYRKEVRPFTDTQIALLQNFGPPTSEFPIESTSRISGLHDEFPALRSREIIVPEQGIKSRSSGSFSPDQGRPPRQYKDTPRHCA